MENEFRLSYIAAYPCAGSRLTLMDPGMHRETHSNDVHLRLFDLLFGYFFFTEFARGQFLLEHVQVLRLG